MYTLECYWRHSLYPAEQNQRGLRQPLCVSLYQSLRNIALKVGKGVRVNRPGHTGDNTELTLILKNK